ncbi:MAG: tRNA (guanosine(37)-N1)-methyltransferase TrmD [Candidatus Sericytochromatia bacterium]
MKINILTLFPEFFVSPLNTSIIKRAIEAESLEVNIIDIRDFTFDKHKKADDAPFGGGCGMVLKPEPIFRAIEALNKKQPNTENYQKKLIFTCPTGVNYDHKKAQEYAKLDEINILCGHYEGIDQRIIDHLIDEKISVGDYVLTGGEIPTLIIIDSVIRFLPNVLGNEDSAKQDSFSDGLLDCPHYTRPANFNGWSVPEILLSGHHKNIDKWRLKEKFKRTLLNRPDLIKNYQFDKKSLKIFEEAKLEINNL